MANKTLRRGSTAFFRDLNGDWISCVVLRVSGSGEPSREISVELKTTAWSLSGFVRAGVVMKKPSIEVVPSTAIRFSEYGHCKESYRCQETYPDRRRA